MDRQVKQNKFKRNIYTGNCKHYKKLDAKKHINIEIKTQ